MNKHTSWHFDGCGVNDENGRRLLKAQIERNTVSDSGRVRMNDEFDKISILAAAAPDLLAALEFARDCLTELAELVENGTFDAAKHWVEGNGEVWDTIRAAIAEARGES